MYGRGLVGPVAAPGVDELEEGHAEEVLVEEVAPLGVELPLARRDRARGLLPAVFAAQTLLERVRGARHLDVHGRVEVQMEIHVLLAVDGPGAVRVGQDPEAPEQLADRRVEAEHLAAHEARVVLRVPRVAPSELAEPLAFCAEEPIVEFVHVDGAAAVGVDPVHERVDLGRFHLGRKRVIQVLFNMSVPRARVPEKASMLRDRSER